MKRLPLLLCLLAGASMAQAQVFTFHADANSAQENNPADTSAATGFADATLDEGAGTFTISFTFSGLTANASAAHVHGPALPGAAAGVLYGFPGVPAATSATVSQSPTLIPLGTGGSYTVAQQEADLLAGKWYVNVHDANFPGGEIRGQLTLTPVPEPQQYALAAGLGLVAFAFYRRLKPVTV